jgi:hypothetical protein
MFNSGTYLIGDLASVADEKFAQQDFSSIVYSEPLYLKNVYTGTKAS